MTQPLIVVDHARLDRIEEMLRKALGRQEPRKEWGTVAEAAALREAAERVAHFYGKGQVTKPEDILALIPEGNHLQRALDKARQEEREACAEIADSFGYAVAVADAIRERDDDQRA